MADLLVANIGQLVTVDPNAPKQLRSRVDDPAEPRLGIIDGAAVVIENGVFRWIGSQRALPERFQNFPTVDAQGRVVLPGLVDCHTHAVFAGHRANEYTLRSQGTTYSEIAANGGGIRRSVTLTRAADRETLFDETRARLVRMLRHGTTVVEIKSGYGLDLETEIRQLEVVQDLARDLPLRIVPTFLGAHDVPGEFLKDGKRTDEGADAYIAQLVDQILPEIARRKLAVFNDVFCEAGVFDVQQSERVLRKGIELGLTPKIHAEELSWCGGSLLAAKLRAVSADHLMEISEEGIRAMVDANVTFVLLPGTTVFLGKQKFAPARRIVELGGRIALATDRNPGSCTAESLILIATLACSNMKLSPAEAIEAITRNAAHALQLEQECGSITVGKQGDLVLFDVHDYPELPYLFGINRASQVIVAGVPQFS